MVHTVSAVTKLRTCFRAREQVFYFENGTLTFKVGLLKAVKKNFFVIKLTSTGAKLDTYIYLTRINKYVNTS